MKCMRCGKETLEQCKITSPHGDWACVKIDKDENAHHFDISTYACSNCGKLEFIADTKPKYIVTKDLELLKG